MERKVEEPGFWDNPEESQKLMKELKHLKELVETIQNLYASYAVSYTHLRRVKPQYAKMNVLALELGAAAAQSRDYNER